MTLLGICGPISSGKSTFAEMLTSVDPDHSLHLESSGLVIELANTFNRALTERQAELNIATDLISLGNELIGALLPQLSVMADKKLNLEQIAINPADLEEHPDWYEKLFVYLRQAQQMPTILEQHLNAENKSNYRPLLQWIGGYFLYRLDDRLLWYKELLRRANSAGPEVKLVVLTAVRHPAEAEFVQNEGGKVLQIVRPGLLSDTSDVTERQVREIMPDVIISNDNTLGAFQKTAQKVFSDITDGKLKPSYSAHFYTK
jgi:hypothetical protein